MLTWMSQAIVLVIELKSSGGVAVLCYSKLESGCTLDPVSHMQGTLMLFFSSTSNLPVTPEQLMFGGQENLTVELSQCYVAFKSVGLVSERSASEPRLMPRKLPG